MPDTPTNLANAVRAPQVILAPASEFIRISGGAHDGMPTAWRTRMGTQWAGLNATFGTITKFSLKYLGDRGEIVSGAPGMPRALYWLRPGYGVEMEVHWDRQQMGLRKGDRFNCWIDTGEEDSLPTKVFFHVEEITGGYSDGDTVTRTIVAEHRAGLDDQADLYRAEVDGLGAVISFQELARFGASESDPANGIPTGSLWGVAWTRAGTVCTCTFIAHGLTTGDDVLVSDSSDTNAVTNGTKTVTVVSSNVFTFACLNAGALTGTCSIEPSSPP